MPLLSRLEFRVYFLSKERTLFRKRPTIQEFVTVNNNFGESATPAELMKNYGIDSDAVVVAVTRIMKT